LDGFLVVEPRNVGIALADCLCDWGGGMTFLDYNLAFVLHLRKSMEILGQGSQAVGDYSWHQLGHIFGDSLGWPTELQFTLVTHGELQSAHSWHKCLPSCQTKGFTTWTNFGSKLWVSASVWLAKNGISKFLWICLLPVCLGAVVTM
jgi:hypothetical protein